MPTALTALTALLPAAGPLLWVLITVLCVRITVHVVIVVVALLHPRRSRRREARQILDCHLPVPRAL
ncbi:MULTISPECIES: hypothetical protein [Streptomyces]|uniref:Uncharacterized protein n=1 Tax=Streptomyces griseus subsp. griseus (strain JCM 4626 / CBS 651.72 / NBRC 13350 / KCC S-0626 / ISP 5235) TaxID=455632 RepID=B1VL93_STRGG|nr:MULTISPECIES: hypothetical protein [Streptomyces]MYR50920.1 hypothetical protein [Streptomyces sp. SID4928]EGE42879.1 hypothetical protein SACT1_3543 [Streptomyces sp. ACT-1]MBW3705776.1 hypothetical protein [Streptomyces griseus]NEB57489.1 hypothetical protein [Streptomyces griseus]SEE83423.1 hypothetical protein SAMN04490359_6232 [Streptomyces griseus]